MKYFDAVVQVLVEGVDGKGNPKFRRLKKNYLVDSLTVTEAEARVVKVFEQMGGVQEFNVIGVNGSRVMSAIKVEGDTDADVKFYEVAVEIKLESSSPDDSIRVKRIKENFLVEAKSVTEAEEKVNKVYTSEGFSSDFEVIVVKRSKVVEIIAPETKDLKELPEGKWLTKKREVEDVEELDNQVEEIKKLNLETESDD
jgi:hypothetical protein